MLKVSSVFSTSWWTDNLKQKKPNLLKEAYRKVASSNTSHLEAHAGFFRLLMKGIFDPYVLWPFDKKWIS